MLACCGLWLTVCPSTVFRMPKQSSSHDSCQNSVAGLVSRSSRQCISLVAFTEHTRLSRGDVLGVESDTSRKHVVITSQPSFKPCSMLLTIAPNAVVTSPPPLPLPPTPRVDSALPLPAVTLAPPLMPLEALSPAPSSWRCCSWYPRSAGPIVCQWRRHGSD
jgi:hypothetical protein